jgi:hypothetical protein
VRALNFAISESFRTKKKTGTRQVLRFPFVFRLVKSNALVQPDLDRST